MIEIKEILLQLPGVSTQQGEQLARMVAQRLAGRLPGNWPNKSIPELNVQLEMADGLSQDQLAERIVNAIWQKVN